MAGRRPADGRGDDGRPKSLSRADGAAIELVGPKGYVHGWIKVGAAKTSLSDWKDHQDELAGLHERTKGDDRRDRVLERIAQIQGFDAKPSEGNLDPSREIVHRGFGDRYGGNESQYAGQFRHGDYHGSTGLRANGTYVTTDEKAASQYGSVLHMQLHPDARTISLPDAEDKLDSLPDGKIKQIVAGDPGRLAAMLGYDAIIKGTHRVILNRGAVRVATDT